MPGEDTQDRDKIGDQHSVCRCHDPAWLVVSLEHVREHGAWAAVVAARVHQLLGGTGMVRHGLLALARYLGTGIDRTRTALAVLTRATVLAAARPATAGRYTLRVGDHHGLALWSKRTETTQRDGVIVEPTSRPFSPPDPLHLVGTQPTTPQHVAFPERIDTLRALLDAC